MLTSLKVENLDTTNIELTDFAVTQLLEEQTLVTLPNGKKAARWQYLELLQKQEGEKQLQKEAEVYEKSFGSE